MPEYRDQADIGEVGGPGIGNVAPYAPSALTCPSCGGAVWEIQTTIADPDASDCLSAFTACCS